MGGGGLFVNSLSLSLSLSRVPQLFDEDNYLNRYESEYVFTTEGHPIRIGKHWREKAWETSPLTPPLSSRFDDDDDVNIRSYNGSACVSLPETWRYSLPLDRKLLYNIEQLVGLN